MPMVQYDDLQFQVNPTSEPYGGDAVFRSSPYPISFCLKSVTRRRSITGRIDYDEPIVRHSQIVAHEREDWTEQLVADQLAAMGIRGNEQRNQIAEILAAVDEAEPGRVIDVTVVALVEVRVDENDDAIDRVTAESMEMASYRRNLIPASKSAIEGLERVGRCSELESEQCAVCMERLIDDGNLDQDLVFNAPIPDADLVLGPDDLLDHETDLGLRRFDDSEHNFDQFREQEDVQCPTKKRKIEHVDTLKHVGHDHDDDDNLKNITRLPCSHHYHTDCIVHWLEINHMCPLCRSPLPVSEVGNS